MTRWRVGEAVSPAETRLLRGAGCYLDDRRLPGLAHAHVLRSEHAHARIVGIATARAVAAPGVLAVLTGADLAADGLGAPRCNPPFPMPRPDGQPLHAAGHPGLARERVRHVGDPVALVVAETSAQARDAAALIDIDYQPLPHVVDTALADAEDAALVWEDCARNVLATVERGDGAAVRAASDGAAHVVRGRFVISRVSANPLETRGCVGVYDGAEGRYTLYCDVQAPHTLRKILARDVFRRPETDFRVVVGDMGGAFGMKGPVYPEQRLVLWAARRTGRPVKWHADRSEAFLGDEHARDAIAEAMLALDTDGRMLALDVTLTVNQGAYIGNERSLVPLFANLGSLVGVYDIRAAHVLARGVYTNTNPTAPYRGAGRPEASYIIERMVDLAAREIGVEPAELRRRNVVPAGAMPYKTALVYTYDSGDFGATLARARELADHAGFEARRAAARARGHLRGLGFSNTIERAGSPSAEEVEIRFTPGGGVFVLAGTMDSGQGHRAMYTQLVGEHLGVAAARVRVVEGDTDTVSFGVGTTGSRSAMSGGSALTVAAGKIIEKGRRIAAHLLECDAGDVAFADGVFRVRGTDLALDMDAVAAAAFDVSRLPPGFEPGLAAIGGYVTRAVTYPNGCHAVEVEVDPETGTVTVERYAVVDDVGVVLNPVAVESQVHGGATQGLGQALLERVVYDAGSGQLLSGSFMDYGMPRAGDLCAFEVQTLPAPTATNPLGVKGVGEAGTVGALPAVVNAVLDALWPLGVRNLDMPLTPERVWRTIRDATPG